jgi:hypothetical protein
LDDAKIPNNYFKNSDAKCSKSHGMKIHNRASKRKKDDVLDDAKVPKSTAPYFCICGKEYKYRQGLWKHQKLCKNTEVIKISEEQNEIKMLTSLVLDVVKQNKELATQNNELTNKIVDLCKDKTSTNICNTNINSNNKTFNLNVFLNETCKDAMNIMEFVDSLKLQLSDLESVGKLGFIEGISNIIVKNLKAMDVHKRPVHCSDSKREVMYVKDQDKWEKENEENHKVLKAIEDIANKNSKMVKEWKTKNPECASSKSHKADVYSHIMIQAVCSNNDTNNNKILKKIAKEVTIDKH